MYSTIKRKTCKCGCLRLPTLGCAGYSYQCMPEELKAKVGDKKKLQQKRLNASKYASTKLRMDNYKSKYELQLWFMFHMVNSKRECENCGADLSHYNATEWKGSQHHIAEKSLCPSVESNIYNHGVLGYYCCHSQWHSSFLNSSKMPFMKIAKQRFQLFKHLIPAEELRKVNPFL